MINAKGLRWTTRLMKYEQIITRKRSIAFSIAIL